MFIGSLLLVTTLMVSAADYEWTFSQGNLNADLGNGTMDYADGATPGLTTFGTTDGTTVPNVDGQSASYIQFPAFADLGNGYQVTLTDSGPNGGGSYINQYTVVMDVLAPGAAGWTPFFNTNPDNGNDADFYVDPSGAIGIGDLGYSSAGVFLPDTWYRVAFAVDLQAGDVAYYLDGNSVFNGNVGGLVDGRFSLFSNLDAGPDLLLFNEGDTSGQYTHELVVSSVMISDRTYSAADILALGGASAGGVLVPEPQTWTLLALGALAMLGRWRRRSSR